MKVLPDSRTEPGRGAVLPPPPREDPVYRAVMALRDPEILRDSLLSAWKREGAEPGEETRFEVVLTHYKPYARARLLVLSRIPREDRPSSFRKRYLSLQVYPTLGDAKERFEGIEKKPLKCWGPAVSLLEDHASVAWSLPNGPTLRTIRITRSGKRFRRFLIRNGLLPESFEGRVRAVKLVRYVPRRRATFRFRPIEECGFPGGYVKVYAPGRDLLPAQNLEEMGRARKSQPLGFRPPRLLVHDTVRRAVVMKRVKGRRLSDLFLDAADSLSVGVGRALAGLHASDVRPSISWSPDKEIRALRRATEDLVRALPALEDRVASVVEALETWRGRLAFPDGRPIHANLFGDQILVTRSGRIGIVDWDDLSLGDPLYDVGRLVAHLLYLAQRHAPRATAASAFLGGMLRAYRGEGMPVDLERLTWHVGVALLMRAKISALRQLPDGWIGDVVSSLELAEGCLDPDVSSEESAPVGALLAAACV